MAILIKHHFNASAMQQNLKNTYDNVGQIWGSQNCQKRPGRGQKPIFCHYFVFAFPYSPV